VVEQHGLRDAFGGHTDGSHVASTIVTLSGAPASRA
jgi:hypothetical protein